MYESPLNMSVHKSVLAHPQNLESTRTTACSPRQQFFLLRQQDVHYSILQKQFLHSKILSIRLIKRFHQHHNKPSKMNKFNHHSSQVKLRIYNKINLIFPHIPKIHVLNFPHLMISHSCKQFSKIPKMMSWKLSAMLNVTYQFWTPATTGSRLAICRSTTPTKIG